ncbi:hypothetical protein QM092_14425 [Enterobacter hormaechei]|uniref:alginate O-acetyltransferase AlgX-related protein n=2 Tax=Enterobacter hormaechei TaxID=158836 RepID=UPI000642D149|nr:hypothetical protein [Enterobacter hormaechei]EHN8833784.1 hypothetical protein [Enterobacter hormaechei]KLR20545.1 hypothetical protein ABR27_01110 [Enterobacter hormaechei subsp. hormaechei]MDV5371204.1 hypothetical protein [Enterobacter hormaechei]MDV5637626.1 hypothetical protein [Enterobacter hormaechei]RTP18256.1 hypothetical protein EKN51_07330 [Enterobacter hormaechei]
MKKYIYGFLLSSAALLAIAPIANIKHEIDSGKKVIDTTNKNILEWVDFKIFYKMDFAIPALSYTLYKMGISLYPEDTIIGKDGWLFLGDKYNKTISENRNQKPLSVKNIDAMIESRHSWDKYVKSYGGIGYFVTFAPDKHSVYSEKAPNWVVNSGGSKNINYLLERSIGDPTFINLGQNFSSLKNNDDIIYYKTDSHWNQNGAWHAYKNLAKEMSQLIPGIKWLSDSDVTFSKSPRPGGDLSNFLRLQYTLSDIQYLITVKPAHSATQNGTDKNELAYLYKSSSLKANDFYYNKNALNNMKVLWLIDSFGGGMKQYMHATFSTVHEQHYLSLMGDKKKFLKVIDEYHPDLVIVTAVERQILIPSIFDGSPAIK